MTDVLAKICADKRQHIADRQAARPLSDVRATAEARNRSDPPRGFRMGVAGNVDEAIKGLLQSISHHTGRR